MSSQTFDATADYTIVTIRDSAEHAIKHGPTGHVARWFESADADYIRDRFAEWQRGDERTLWFDEGDDLDTRTVAALHTPDVDWATAETPPITIDELWAELGKQANERGWCSEYDDFAARLGGPERPKRLLSYNVRVPFTFSVQLPETYHADQTFNELDNVERRTLVNAAMRNLIDNWATDLSEAARDQLATRLSRYVGIVAIDPNSL